MTLAIRALAVALLLPSAACLLPGTDTIERPITRTFAVTEADLVRVRVSGGSITVTTGEDGEVEATLTARARTDSEAEANDWMADYDVVLERQEHEIVVSARRKPGATLTQWFGDRGQVQFRANVRVPANVAVNLDTSGGAIRVEGQRTSAVTADTSGGSITVDGSTGPIDVDTSGGGITIGHTLSDLRANTSGGSINVGYVGPGVRAVDLDTSGGGIHVGVDPQASLKVSADTSGGSVSADGLNLTDQTRERNRISGSMNGGEGVLRVHTSGGSIRIEAADDRP
jgi:hypothetical protein